MSETTTQEQPRFALIGLGRGHNGFYCPESRFHLVGTIKPQANWPLELPLTTDIKHGIQTGTLVDITGVLTPEQLGYELTIDSPVSSADRKREQQTTIEETAKKEEAGEEVPPAENELLSEPDIDGATKKRLLAFIKENKLVIDGINGRSTEDEVKDALKIHFGYKAAPAEDTDK